MDDMCIQRAGQGSIGMELRHQRAEELGKLLINKRMPKSGKFHNASACGRCKKSWNWNWRELALHILPKLRVLLSFLQAVVEPYLWRADLFSLFPLEHIACFCLVCWGLLPSGVVFVTNVYGHCGQL